MTDNSESSSLYSYNGSFVARPVYSMKGKLLIILESVKSLPSLQQFLIADPEINSAYDNNSSNISDARYR